MREGDRRAVLRCITALATAGATTGVTGCLEHRLPTIPIMTERFTFVPGTVATDDHYSVRYVENEPVDDTSDELPDRTVDSIRTRAEWVYEVTGMEFDDVNRQLTFRTVAVVNIPEFQDTDDIIDELTVNGFEESDDADDYRVFVSADDRYAVGVETGWLIGAAPAPDEPDPEVVVENVVGTELGRVDRYADEVEAFSALIEELGGHVFVGGSHAETADTDIDSERFEGEVARGLSADLDGETTDVRLSLVFDDAELVAPDEIADWTETNTFEAWKEVTVEEDEDDPALTVSGTVDTSEFTLSVPGGHDVDALVDW